MYQKKFLWYMAIDGMQDCHQDSKLPGKNNK